MLKISKYFNDNSKDENLNDDSNNEEEDNLGDHNETIDLKSKCILSLVIQFSVHSGKLDLKLPQINNENRSKELHNVAMRIRKH